MGNAAKAHEQQQQHAVPTPTPKRVRPAPAQQEHGYGRVDVDCLVPWLNGHRYPGYPQASDFFTPKECAVLREMIAGCNFKNGRCDLTVSVIADRAECDRSTVRAIVGGAGYQSSSDRFGNALPPGLQEGSLGGAHGLIEHVWLSPNRAQRELPKDDPWAKKGRSVNRLRFATISQLVTWGKRRLREERAERQRRARAARTERAPLNYQHSAPPVQSAAPLAQNQHSKTRIPSDLPLASPERTTGSIAPAFSSDARARRAPKDDASRPAAPGSSAPPAPASHAARPANDPQSTEGTRARDVPPPPAPPAEVRAQLEAIGRLFVREHRAAVASDGTPMFGPIGMLTLVDRWRHKVATLDELECAAWGGAHSDRVRRTARHPFAFVFANRVTIAQYAHEGRAIRAAHERDVEARLVAALEREARRAAVAAEVPCGDELARELANLPILRQRAAVEAHRATPLEELARQLREAWAWARQNGDDFSAGAVAREFAEKFGVAIDGGKT